MAIDDQGGELAGDVPRCQLDAEQLVIQPDLAAVPLRPPEPVLPAIARLARVISQP